MKDDAGERTEEATPRQVERFRDQGRVATSRELVAAASLTAGAVGAVIAAPMLLEATCRVAWASLGRAASGELALGDVQGLVVATLTVAGPGVLVCVGPAAAASLLTGLGLTGFNTSLEALGPKLERLDPFANAANQLFSSTPWIALARSALVAGLIAWSVAGAVGPELAVLPAAASWSAAAQLAFLGHLGRAVLERALPVMLLVGVADYGWQRWQLGQQMRMSRQQVREEHKESEGDPLLKQRRRQRARQIAADHQLRDVARADVVVTNPTHYAVALRYHKAENVAPVVLARGVDLFAMRIRAAAGRADVPVVENRPLARALYARGRVGGPVPRELFGAVAKVLAAVYRRRRR